MALRLDKAATRMSSMASPASWWKWATVGCSRTKVPAWICISIRTAFKARQDWTNVAGDRQRKLGLWVCIVLKDNPLQKTAVFAALKGLFSTHLKVLCWNTALYIFLVWSIWICLQRFLPQGLTPSAFVTQMSASIMAWSQSHKGVLDVPVLLSVVWETS